MSGGGEVGQVAGDPWLSGIQARRGSCARNTGVLELQGGNGTSGKDVVLVDATRHAVLLRQQKPQQAKRQ